MKGSSIETIIRSNKNDGGIIFLIPIDAKDILPSRITFNNYIFTVLIAQEIFSLTQRDDGKKLCAITLHPYANEILEQGSLIYYV